MTILKIILPKFPSSQIHNEILKYGYDIQNFFISEETIGIHEKIYQFKNSKIYTLC